MDKQVAMDTQVASPAVRADGAAERRGGGRTAGPHCEAGLRTAGGGPVRTAGGASALRSACGPHAAFLPSAVLMIRTAGDPHS